MADKKKTIKAWAVVNKFTGYLCGGIRYGIFIKRTYAIDYKKMNPDINENWKVIPVEIKL